MAKDYTYLLKEEFERAKRALIEIDGAFAASGAQLTNDELEAMGGNYVRYGLLPYLREKMIRQACINEGLSLERYETSSYEMKKMIKAKSELLGHKYDAFLEEWGVPNIDGGPYRIVAAGREYVHRFERHPNADAWLFDNKRQARRRGDSLNDYFTTREDGTLQLRADWEKTLEASYTAIIPPEMRPAWNTLQRIKKELHDLEDVMKPGQVTLAKLCAAADDPDSLVQGIYWK